MIGVIVFVRVPELGKVKTRLAKDVGDVKALHIYNQLLDHTHSVISELVTHNFIFYTPYIESNDLWSGHQYSKYLQTDGDLGQKIKHAFSIAFNECDQVIIIGSDCAQLNTHHLEESFDLLKETDVVIGPTLDGGYYLLGLNKYEPKVFEKIDWSTENVLNQTIEQIRNSNMTFQLIEKLSDIDYLEDWEKYGLDKK